MKVNWVAVLILGVAALFVLMLGASLLSGFGGYGRYGGYGGWGMMGPGMMGGWGFAPFGWAGMPLMWLLPLGFLALLVLGVAWLVRAVSRAGSGQPPVVPARTCANCHRPVQADWRNCPYCGTVLE